MMGIVALRDGNLLLLVVQLCSCCLRLVLKQYLPIP